MKKKIAPMRKIIFRLKETQSRQLKRKGITMKTPVQGLIVDALLEKGLIKE